MSYKKLYYSSFNTITDEIKAHEERIEKLKQVQQELEENYVCELDDTVDEVN